MSRNFPGGNNTDKIVVSNYSEIGSKNDVSICIWFNTNDVTTAAQELFRKEGSPGFLISFESNVVEFIANVAGFGIWSAGSLGLSINTWYVLVVTYDGSSTANDPIIYIDGVSKTVAEDATPSFSSWDSGTGSSYIGNRSTDANTFDGELAEVAFWDRSLTAGEAACLGAGYSPLFLATGLEMYMPVIGRQSPEVNYMNTTGGTVTGTSQAAHPPVFNRAGTFIGLPATAVAAGGRIMSSLANYGGLAGPGGIAGQYGGLAG